MQAESWTLSDVPRSTWTSLRAVNVSRLARDLLLRVASSNSAVSILDRRP